MKLNKIEQFNMEFRFLSNFFPSPIIWKGLAWPTVEHAFQAAKTTSSRDFHNIKNAATPGIAKHVGTCITLREDWEEIKIDIMTDLVFLKFKQNPSLRKQLLSTDTQKLVEGNWWHDNFWGDCACRKCSNIKGKNVLGIILMEVREELQNRQNRLTDKILKIQITKEYLRKNPNHVLVFGDNTIHRGKGGAAILRDEPNTFGFITKKYPNNSPDSFYTPDEYMFVYGREIRILQNEVDQHPDDLFLIAKIGSNLANKYGIFEEIIEPNIKKDMSKYTNVKFLW